MTTMPSRVRTILRLSVAFAACGASIGFLWWRFDSMSRPVQGPPLDPVEAAAIEASARASMFEQFDLSDLRVDRDDLMLGGPPKDGIEALTRPPRVSASIYSELTDQARVIEVVEGDEAVAYPVLILTGHEIVNDEVGGRPLAITYCPLCDSAMVFDRRIKHNGQVETLEFGVSGLLLNSNVVMYDRTHHALWNQLTMDALSGPMSGAMLDTLPFRVTTFGDFKSRHPEGMVLPLDASGTRRPYEMFASLYRGALTTDELRFPVPNEGRDLPRKTLGIGIRAGASTIFVAGDAVAKEPLTVSTELGEVVVASGPRGMQVLDAPEGVGVVQTFYYAWSAAHPSTEIIGPDRKRMLPGESGR